MDSRERTPSQAVDRHWQANCGVTVILLLVWAVAGLGCGILFADRLQAFELGGFPLGFWFAQQGSILIFVALILIYAAVLNVLDARYRRERRQRR